MEDKCKYCGGELELIYYSILLISGKDCDITVFECIDCERRMAEVEVLEDE